MSYDDNNRNDPERGAYTPPDDDDLPFRFDARRETGRPAPRLLIVSVVVLLVLLAAIGLIYGIGGVRSPGDAPPVVGEPVGDLTGPAPVEAQPVNPEADISVYEPAPEAGTPTFAAPPETVQPRPEPREPAPQPEPQPLPPARTAATPTPAPADAASPPQAETAPAPRTTPASGSSAVQIGAFSSREIADREYAAVAAAFPEFARGRTKSVQQVTSSSGQTLYRTTFNGFSREQAVAFCAALRNAGRDCLVR